MAHHNNEIKDIKKKAQILDYFFQHPKEFLETKSVQVALNISQNGYRTMIRNFQFFHYFGVLESKNDINIDREEAFNSQINKYDKSYRLTTNEKVKFQIPSDPDRRFLYATLVSQLFTDEKDEYIGIDDETYILPIVNTRIFGLITKISNGIFRDVLLASKIYEYFHCKKGNLLSIVAELSYFEQPIWIKFKDGTEIKNGIIHSIGIYEDGAIELSINNMTIAIETIDEIVDIYVLSKNYPSSKVGLPNINKVILFDALKNQPEYDKMVEIYDEHCINRDFPNDSLEEFIKRECDPINKDCLTLIERAKRKIRLIN